MTRRARIPRTAAEPEHAARAPEPEAHPEARQPQADLRRLSGSAGNQAVGQLLDGGRALDPATRAAMEEQLGADLGDVRLHTDARAAAAAESVQARAFTAGQDVVFGEGAYAPETPRGRRLLAHELAHVVQQHRAGARRAPGMSRAGDPFETAAERAASGDGPGHLLAAGAPPAVQRDEKEEEEKKPPTAEELAAKEVKAGPKGKKELEAFKKAAKLAEAAAKGTTARRVTIDTSGDTNNPTRAVASDEYKREFSACPSARQETRVPQAFTCATRTLGPPLAATAEGATIGTNVRVGTKAGKGASGEVWVESATLPWTLTTSAFLNVSEIDPSMLTPFSSHEKGHRAIARQIRDALAPLLEAELEATLPTERKPLKTSGSDWAQKGVDQIVARTQAILDRYDKWFDELTARADGAWDAQEKKTLSDIAAKRKAAEFKPGSSVPEVP